MNVNAALPPVHINNNMGNVNAAPRVSANEPMHNQDPFSPVVGFTLLEIPYDPNIEGDKLFINPYIDLEYMQYLNNVVGPIPGTEILKVNCASSSLFSLGLAQTDEYADETQQGQAKQNNTHNKYGRTYEEMCYFIARKFNIKGIYNYSFAQFLFNTFPNIIELKEGFYRIFLDYLKELLVEGSGTIIQYGKGNTHAVSIIKHQGKLYMYDYQQQYVIPEEDIFEIIIRQSSTGTFYINGQLKEGYDFITGEEDIKNISIYVGLTHEKQLYNRASPQSLAIVNRMKLYKAVTTKEAFKTFKNEVAELGIYKKAALIMESYGYLTLEDDYRRRSLNIHDLKTLIFFMIRNIEGNDAKNDAIRELISTEIQVADKVIQDNFDLFRIWEIIIQHYHTEETANAGMATDAPADFNIFLNYLRFKSEGPAQASSRKSRKQRKQRKQKKSRKQRKQKI